jgi:hypothetical protein
METDVIKTDAADSLRHGFAESAKNPFAAEKERDMLRFAQKMAISDSSFLRDFPKYLKDRFGGGKSKSMTDGGNPMVTLFDFIINIYMLPEFPESFSNKGCALLGKTLFDKLDFTRAFLESHGASEYAVINCVGKAGKLKRDGMLISLIRKYKDVPFVIFNNCDDLLGKEDYLVTFKHLSEYNRTITFLADEGDPADANFSVKSWYIFLGNESRIHEAFEKAKSGLRSGVQAHIDAFLTHIHVYDFDKGSRYYGHGTDTTEVFK